MLILWNFFTNFRELTSVFIVACRPGAARYGKWSANLTNLFLLDILSKKNLNIVLRCRQFDSLQRKRKKNKENGEIKLVSMVAAKNGGGK